MTSRASHPDQPARGAAAGSAAVTEVLAAGAAKAGAHAVASTSFEPEFARPLAQMFEEHVVFNRVLGLRITRIEAERVEALVPMRPELIGHFTAERLHGGVISAALDAMGGLAVMAAIGARHMDEPPLQRLGRFAKLGTIDLRIDYLRPATGAAFSCDAEVMRLGSRVASTRMQFRKAESGLLLATGSAAYIVS
jgi:uncharacterized protein (TIGR00369 family)